MKSLIIVCLFFFSSTYGFNKKTDCKCRGRVFPKIIGGNEVSKSAYPWHVMLSYIDSIPDYLRIFGSDDYKINRLTCGASIINNYWILTAAHCIPNQASKFLKIGYGDNDLVQIYNKKQYVEIEEAIVHPHFSEDAENVINDIALIKLSRPLKFNNDVQPACLETKNVSKYDGLLKLTGWGAIKTVEYNKGSGKENVKVSRYLKEAVGYDNSHSLELCKDTNQNICVDNKNSKDRACKGDSGGPLHYTENGKTKVVGVASFVDLDVLPNKIVICKSSTAYTRLSTFIKWVESYVGENYCSY